MDAADNLSAEEGKYIPDTLANRLREQRRLPTDAVRRMADELIANLETLHRRGLLHRDLKPDNILWVDGSAILGDIGLVTDTTNVSLAGTPGFLPPEVLAGIREYHQADDYYSLGKVIYCALTGMPVEKYPAYPASLTLCGGADMIRLYISAPDPSRKRRSKPRFRAEKTNGSSSPRSFFCFLRQDFPPESSSFANRFSGFRRSRFGKPFRGRFRSRRRKSALHALKAKKNIKSSLPC